MAYRRLCIDEEGGVGVSMLWGLWGAVGMSLFLFYSIYGGIIYRMVNKYISNH